MDPITYTIIRHRLFRVVEEAVITLKHVSGSATTNEGHDLMVSLYRADGSLLMGGVGFLHHLTSAAEACKSIIRRFEGQIEPGDLFMLNDPYTAALHTSDVYMLAPIYHAGVLVAWSACFVHVTDIGAMNPGGFAPDASDIYSEGFSSPGLKLVSKGELRRDVWDTFLNMVRNPEMVALDLRSLIACNNVAGERMLALIEKYGADAVDEVGRTLIEQSERLLRQRLLELPNGSWQSRQYIEVKGEISKILLTMTKQTDTLTFDFTGSSPQSPHSVNCTKWAALGGLFAPLFPLLCYDITWNQGAVAPVRMIAPEGSIVNCTRPAPVSVATVGAIQSVNNAACSAIGKMLAASGKYADEATAVWHANHFAVFLFGQTREGRLAIDIMTETFAGAGGAKTYGDGVDIGGEMPNPISRMANVETVEGALPVRYLFRRRMLDSGGAGEYRGGLGGELAIVPHGSPGGGINFVLSGKGSKFPMSDGLAGGGSGTSNDYVLVKGADSTSDRHEETDFASLSGERTPISWGVFALEKGDAFYLRWNGGGGVGDALLRPLESVRTDVMNGKVSEKAAKEIYGVVLKDGEVDDVASEVCRTRLKAARLEQGVTA
ncbi:MAG: hydantoinase B/oxoprolinase family protein [Burkholderiaceae bacterium]|nr:MAG: hydantoinase B/oxoprolinase family protein [Burkholderiaceae bacterium]